MNYMRITMKNTKLSTLNVNNRPLTCKTVFSNQTKEKQFQTHYSVNIEYPLITRTCARWEHKIKWIILMVKLNHSSREKHSIA